MTLVLIIKAGMSFYGAKAYNIFERTLYWIYCAIAPKLEFLALRPNIQDKEKKMANLNHTNNVAKHKHQDRETKVVLYLKITKKGQGH